LLSRQNRQDMDRLSEILMGARQDPLWALQVGVGLRVLVRLRVPHHGGQWLRRQDLVDRLRGRTAQPQVAQVGNQLPGVEWYGVGMNFSIINIEYIS
jgi:predicted NBD/HSP70 family sugar kinase